MGGRITFAIAAILTVTVAWCAAPAHATFPGKNGKIAFVELFTHQPATINADGTDRTQLPPVGDFPAWSADGMRLAFGQCVAPFSTEPLCTTDSSGGDVREVPGALTPTFPAWSPSGDRLAIDDSACGPTSCTSHAIVTLGLDGSNRTVLNFDGSAPDWSPDGTRIAFDRFYPGTPPDRADLFVINSDGTGLRQLTGPEQARETEPSWSPDGTRIAYTGFTPGTEHDIYVINADGTGRRQVTNAGGNEEAPVWSPDGTKIAYVSSANIRIVNADGTGDDFLTTGGLTPDWQPIPGPRRGDYKNAAHFCRAERDFWGAQFPSRYGGGANAYGKCVSSS